MQRCLVTGATGFVGAELCRQLVERGDRVRALVRASSSRHRLEALPIGPGGPLEVAIGDLADPAALEQACAGVDRVFHVAGLVDYRSRAAQALHEVNVVGTRNVLAAARRAGVARVVHTSSVVAVGASRSPRALDEAAAWNLAPLRGGYFDTKRAAEDEVRRALDAGQDVVIVNPAAVMGPGDSRGNLTFLAARLAKGARCPVPQGGVDLVDNRDVAQGHVLAAERGRRGERYVLGAENVTYEEFAKRLAAALGREARTVVLPRKLCRAAAAVASLLDRFRDLAPPLAPVTLRSMGLYFWYDHGKAVRELGWTPRPVQGAIDEAVAWMREHGELPPEVMP